MPEKSRCGIFAAAAREYLCERRNGKAAPGGVPKKRRDRDRDRRLKPAPGEEGQERKIAICAGHSTSSALQVST